MEQSKSFDLYITNTAADQDPASSIEYLIETYGEGIFQKLLSNLLKREFEQQEAIDHWRTAMQGFSDDSTRMNWRAVILDYLYSRANLLQNPCIIEAEELQRLQIESVTDGLTNLFNQSHFKQRLATVIQEHEERPDLAFSLIILDLDHFKQFNDRCGHLRGDHALAKIGKLICSRVPETAVAARYGGEEFAIILPGTDLHQAIELAEEIRAAVERTSFDGEDRLDSGNLTISGGVASYPSAGKTSVALIAHADSKLYEAKVNRNRIAPRLTDTRTIIRHNVRSIVEIFDETTGAFKNSLSSDISYTGILLKSPTAADIGSNLQLRFPYPFWPTDHDTNGQVRHVRSNDTRGDFLIGIEFLQPQTDFVEQILPAEIYAANR